MPHILTTFCAILRNLLQKKASTALIKCKKKKGLDVIGKRTSDQTTNHPKKSKKRTSQMLGNYFFNLQNKNQNTQQLLLSEFSDKKKPHIAADTKGLKIYTEKQINGCTALKKYIENFGMQKQRPYAKIKSTADGARQAKKAINC